MLEGMFDEPDDILNGNATCVQNQYQRRGKNYAQYLDLPPQPKEEYGFVGLKNQGATCYLNSLIQALFMSPELRDIIFQLPLDELFGQFTETLTKSFGWESKECFQQQDIQEANRVIFDVLERALYGTQMSEQITKFYKGTLVNHITCMNCQIAKEREEPFFDIILQVKDIKSLEESLMAFITPEILEGDNKYFCENCQQKHDALKGQKIRKLPEILSLSLNRFEFDFEKFQRVKIDSEFKFGLELNATPYLEDTDVQDEDYMYELFTVLIHRGSAHGGHYLTYIRDYLCEGNWNKKMEKYHEQKQKRIKQMKEVQVEQSKLQEQQQQEQNELKQKVEKQQIQLEQQIQQKQQQNRNQKQKQKMSKNKKLRKFQKQQKSEKQTLR
ncbi:ubiquitin specific peptidase 40, putative [Ichthyophthirius multifiliis]|uniref:Ubiquitin specific peptidase 40, putative n=1 Tax=Ichthyophthirius multifiliis TaxID=5932 RepID=G0QV33_ICHMU|nr:ubiquitin specific peptidase 40, putative [Ichthyophthirius multifiliis]EGR30926.1 ubiquitin specific peptidase 40, putative [Ichthyophthirius multifiliis]|eukprot:XP_004032513.1 ubiquitin specific peptidase 40, putative [Ichthyophthirius multifiliis]